MNTQNTISNDELKVYVCNKREAVIIENEILFKKNKKNINFKLVGNEKYFYANECAIFTREVMKHGFSKFDYHKNLNHLNEDIKKYGISFHKYSINIGYTQYGTDLKRFKNKDELLGYVIGYNEALKDELTVLMQDR
tara:strand:- start:31 stop:441 length:411 start_codon:yes stop_codon:yes gene_type:complete